MNIEKWEKALAKRGVKKGYIADMLDISLNTLWRKTHGLAEWSTSEVITITKGLNLSDKERRDIFGL